MSHSKVPYQSSTIKADLQAFKCTITFLTYLRNYRNDIYPADKHKLTRIGERVLKLCTALAQIAVIDHEVVAVGVEHSDNAPNPSALLRVVVSTNFPELSLNTIRSRFSEPGYDNPLHPKAEAEDELEFQMEPYIVTMNLRDEDPPLSLPTIVPTKMPKAISSLGEDFNAMLSELRSTEHTPKSEECHKFKAILDKYLSEVRSIGGPPNLEEHLWVLEMIFNVWKDQGELSRRLLPYITATCYPKMHNRLKNSKSQSYLQALRNISVESVSFVESPDISSKSSETNQDMRFLRMFSKGSPGDLFLEGYDSIHALGNGSGIHITLYNSKTCRDFHRLLLSFLKTFQKDLKDLVQLRKKISQPTPQFDVLTTRVLWIGHCLRFLSESAALRIHLQNIESLLLLPEPDTYDGHEDKDGDVDGEEEEEEDDEVDEELEDKLAEHTTEAVQSPSAPDRWERFRKWLKIIISHFDAASILTGAISKPGFPPIATQILRAPRVEQTSMQWKEVLKNPRYFPTYRVPVQGFAQKSNDEILQFLTDGVSSPEARELVTKIHTDWKELIDRGCPLSATEVRVRADSIVKNLNAVIAIHSTPAYSRIANAILTSIGSGFTNDNTFSFEHIPVDLITEDIKFMLKIRDIFSCLKGDRLRFKGGTHCEVSLASLLSTEAPVTLEGFEDILGKVQAYGPIIGVSKRCCPVCYDILSHLKCKVSQTPFHTRGHHHAISSCALPEWLPSRIVDEMNELYGQKLKEALTVFIGRSELQRHRGNSSGLSVLSTSDEMQDDDIADNILDWVTSSRI